MNSLDESFFMGVKEFDLIRGRLLEFYNITALEEITASKELAEKLVDEFKGIIIKYYKFFYTGIEAGIFNEKEVSALSGFYEFFSKKYSTEYDPFLIYYDLRGKIKAYKERVYTKLK